MSVVELEPIDRYEVKRSAPITPDDQHIVYSLYQPLIGVEAIGLYMTLLTEFACRRDEQQTHYFLMNVLDVNVQTIFEWRIQLEAVGLLSTYRLEREASTYYYVLHPPVSAQHFFEDPLLSTFLFSKVGEPTYIQLRSRFTIEEWRTPQMKNETRTFTDLFKPTSVQHMPPLKEGEQFERSATVTTFPFQHPTFEFERMKEHLPQQLLSPQYEQQLPKRTIEQLAYIYSYTPYEMADIILIAMNQSGGELKEEHIRKSAVDYYKLNRSKEVPTMERMRASSPPSVPYSPSSKLSKEDELVYYFNTVTPLQLFIDLSGKKPFSSTMTLIERFVNEHEMPIPVVNVLLHYIYLRNDGKITTGFAESIAQHWMNKKVTTAEEAIRLSKEEHSKYVEWQRQPKQHRTSSYRKPIREEKLPAWFGKEDQTPTEETSSEEVEQLRMQLMEELGIEAKKGEAEDGTD